MQAARIVECVIPGTKQPLRRLVFNDGIGAGGICVQHELGRAERRCVEPACDNHAIVGRSYSGAERMATTQIGTPVEDSFQGLTGAVEQILLG